MIKIQTPRQLIYGLANSTISQSLEQIFFNSLTRIFH